MASLLIATKVRAPAFRRGMVARDGLVERLRRGTQAKLALISAPPGFGKTTLIAAHVAAAGTAAWLSLDRQDNEAATFWSSVVAALQTLSPGFGGNVRAALEAGEAPGEPLLTGLINALAAQKQDLDLVLDDYHVIERSEIHEGIGFLLDHLPPGKRLVVGTRSDPPLPLARLRARGELVEIRAGDLRFSAEEAKSYLNDSMRLGLAPSDVATLALRTEGWAAALQLAALSLEGRRDAGAFIAEFAGDDRYVVDYLVEEVLQRQPERVRCFLLQTCHLERLSGPLCDAVTTGQGSGAMLEALVRANLFVVPLDARREWYRYHHLFADALLTQLDEAGRAALPALHRRASDWYEQHGERSDAIHHALVAEDFERAAELIELAIPEMQRNRKEAVTREWARALPDALVRARPVLGIGVVGVLASSGEFDEVEERLRDVEKCLEMLAGTADPDARRVAVADEKELRRVPATVELYRAALSQVRGDLESLIDHAGRVLDLAPTDDLLNRAAAAALLGIAYWSKGDLKAALRSWTDSKNGLLRIGNVSDALGVSIALADIELVLGHPREALEVYEEALRLSAAKGDHVLRGTADMHTGLCEIYREQNDLGAARQHLQKCQELGERAGLPQHPYRWRVAAARLRQDEGDPEGAIALLDEAERLYVGDFFPNVRPVASIRARFRIAQGRLSEAARWTRGAGLDVDDDLSYLHEFEHITLARLLLAQAESDKPGGMARLETFLDRLLVAAEAGERNGRVIEILILKALANRRNDVDAALVALEHALSLAASEPYARLFLDEGPPMETLLKLAARRRIAPDYVRSLLAAFGPPTRKPESHPDLIEPLSERELDVLRLLRSDLAGPDIARELRVSPNTMRTHTKNIFEKLGVNNRRSAVRRAEELNLLSRSNGQ